MMDDTSSLDMMGYSLCLDEQPTTSNATIASGDSAGGQPPPTHSTARAIHHQRANNSDKASSFSGLNRNRRQHKFFEYESSSSSSDNRSCSSDSKSSSGKVSASEDYVKTAMQACKLFGFSVYGLVIFHGSRTARRYILFLKDKFNNYKHIFRF